MQFRGGAQLRGRISVRYRGIRCHLSRADRQFERALGLRWSDSLGGLISLSLARERQGGEKGGKGKPAPHRRGARRTKGDGIWVFGTSPSGPVRRWSRP